MPPQAAWRPPFPGFATRAGANRRIRPPDGPRRTHIDFYIVLASYKLAIIVEGIHARYLAGETVGEGFEGMGDRAALLMRNALKLADESSDPRLRG